MKQESSKKNKKLIWLIAGLAALLVVLGVVLAIFIMPGSQQGETGPVGGRPDLYWNVDRQMYIGDEESAGLSTREPAEDGLYHIRFSYNGELVEYTFADKRMVNFIDNMDVMTLVKDAEGNVIDALDPETVATEVAKSFFVQRKNGNSLMLNSSIAMNGMQVPVEICELTQIYNVDASAEVPGQIGELDMMDKLLVYANDKGEVTHIYILERQPLADVYWRVGKYWDSTNKTTTREPDENGVYTLTFAKDGKHVELKCKDKAIVDNIDNKGVEYNAPKGLQLDEEGYIVAEVDPAIALRGKLAGSEYHITEMNDNQITATYLLSGKENGKTFSVTIPDDCPIYNVCVGGSADMIGEPTELQMYDRIICYTDLEGKPVLIYVMYRMANVPMYWNITRMYNSTTKETAREPVNGYYVFKMAVGGKQVTLRTKDKAIASEIDSFSYFMCGLDVEGDIIKRVYKPVYVSGNDVYGAGGARFMVSQTGMIMSFVTTTVGNFKNPTNLVMLPNVEIYDVTGYPGTTIGEPTTVKEGDTFRFVADYNNNITHIYVVARYTGMPIYYNFSRQYNANKAQTTRKPDAEGYYVYEMASRGKTVTVKTKDKNIANTIDAQNAPIVALDVRGGIVHAAYEAVTSLRYGYKTANFHRFEKMNDDGTMSALVENTGKSYTFKVAEDVKIYNCSDVYNNNRGERVYSMQYWDQIQGVATKEDGTIKEIYIMKRQAESKFYYNISRQYNTTTKQTTRVPNEEGYYVYDLVVDGAVKQFMTKDPVIASIVDSFNSVPFGMRVSGNIIKGAFAATSIKGVKGVGGTNYDVVSTSNGKLSLTCYLPSSANRGKSVELPLASNYKAYNVSSYADPMGEKCKLAKGDRLVCYTNMDGEVEWAFILCKNTHQKGHISYCEHCGKNVYWLPYIGNTYSAYEDVHLYLPANCVLGQANHGKLDMPESDRTEAVIDLNGYTMTALTARNFLVYGDMVILDTVGGGKLLGGKKGTSGNGGAIMISRGGNVTLLGGTLTEDPESLSNTKGGVVYLGAGGTFTMKGGVIEGGTATQGGGNIWIADATFNMSGGVVKGDILVTSPEAKINISDKANITMGQEYGLKTVEGVTLPLGGVTADTKVVVDAAGVFTEKNANINNYLNNFVSSTSEIPVVVKDSALASGLLKHCQHCDKDVYFTRYAPSGCFGASHMVVVEDMTMTRQVAIGTSSRHTDDVVIDLNGHTVTTTKLEGDTSGAATGRFALVYAKLSIMDTSAAGTGKITTNYSSNRYCGMIMGSTGAVINLYSGTLTHEEGVVIESSGGIIGLLGYEKLENGTVKPGGVLNMYGGVISNGTAKNGGNITIAGNSTFNFYGGVVKDGSTIQANAAVKTKNEETGKVTAYTYSNACGGNIYMSSNAVLNVGSKTGATAVISGGKARTGGNIFVSSKANVTIEKTGVVENGSTLEHRANELDLSFNGGNIHNGGTVTVKGRISNGQAWGGGNLQVTGSCKLIVDGGVIENGVATGSPGGNVYANNAIIELKNGALVTGGKAEKSYGGNISNGSGGEIYIDNSVVSNGVAKSHAGNIYQGGRTYTQENKETKEIVYKYDKGTLSLTNNAQVTGGVATKNGGNIYIVAGDAVITDAKISGGVASSGGNVYATYLELFEDKEDAEKVTGYLEGDIQVANTQILDGTSVSNTEYTGGGNIYAVHSTITMLGSKVAGGVAGQCGGNILVTFGNAVIGEGTVFEGGRIDSNDPEGVTNDHLGSNVCKFNSGIFDIQKGARVTGGEGCATQVYGSDSKKKNGGYIVSGEIEGLMTVYNGTVTEINSGKITGELNITGNAVVTLNGDAQVNYMSGKVVLGDLTQNAKIVVSTPGTFSNVDAEKAQAYADAGYFEAKDTGLDVVAWEGALATGVVRNCAHCQGAPALFSAFNPSLPSAERIFKKSVHLIVLDSCEMSKQYQIGEKNVDPNVDVVIDLNGKTIETAGRFALSYAKLSILDSSEGKTGKIVGKSQNNTVLGGLIMASTGSETNVYSGTLTMAEGAYAGTGGIFHVAYGTLNVHKDAVITGGVVKTDGSKDSSGNYKHSRGGNIWADTSAIINIYGTVSNGVAEALATSETNGDTVSTTYVMGHGGNIATKDANSIVITIADGAVVSGGKAAKGGNIYVGKNAELIVNGKVENGVAEAKENTEKVGDAAPTVTGTYGGEGGNIFILDGGESGGMTVGETGQILNGQATTGGNVWAGYTSTVLGKIIGGKATSKGGNVYHKGVLKVGKQDGSVAAEISGGEAGNGGSIYSDNELNVFKNAVVKDGKSTGKYGGNIFANSSVTVKIYGTVSGGKANTYGGNIASAGGAKVYVIGGTVSGGEAKTYGGNIQSNNGYIYLQENATVSGGTAGTNGGNIYLSAANDGRGILISGSTVTDGTANGTAAQCGGGNIFIIGKATTKNNVTTVVYATLGIMNSEISDGEASQCGGNIYSSYSNVTVDGCQISGGKAGANGGNIYACNLVVKNTTISGGEADNGGNIYGFKEEGVEPNILIENATISDGVATATGGVSGGGNIYLTAGTLTIDGANAKIYDGEATYIGGNVNIASGVFNMKNGEIKGGNSINYWQDNIRLSGKNTIMNFTGGTIYGTNGASAGNGSAITCNSATLRIGGNATVKREDGSKAGLVYILQTGSKLNVLNGWSGEFSFYMDGYTQNYAGATISTDRATCGTLAEDGTYTVGNATFTGTLTYSDNALSVSLVEGALKIAANP